jgi:SAM-dependent methyltransferase
MLDIARTKGVETRKGSSMELDFNDNSFDLVYCIAVFHHVSDPAAVKQTISSMVRVCKNGGHVVFWDHNPWNPYWKIFMKRLPQDAYVTRLVPAGELVAALPQQSRYEVNVRYLGWLPDFCPPFMLGFAQRLEKLIEHTVLLSRFGAHHVVTVRKL